ncbi:hypothetical protein L0F63_002908 [Massospora cicadina]|nr:hypothetical protein L0F63_002908 [Massospora cicadina]
MKRLSSKETPTSAVSNETRLNLAPCENTVEVSESAGDSDQDLDADLDLGAAPNWRQTLYRHLRLLLFGGTLIVAAALFLSFYLGADILNAVTDPPARDTPWDTALALRLLLWAALVFISAVSLSFLLAVIPAIALSVNRLVVPSKIETTKERIEAFKELRMTLLYSGVVLIAFVTLCILFPSSVTFDLDEGGLLVSMFRAAACVLIFSLFVTLEKMLMQLTSVRFHRTAYKQRIQESRLATQILDKLNAAIGRNGASYSKIVKLEGARAQRGQTSDGENVSDAETSELSPNASSGLGSQASLLKSNPKVGQGPKAFKALGPEALRKDDDPGTQLAARKLARKIFFALQKNRKHLLVEDFVPWFRDREEAAKAFNFFDRDLNGDISWSEMRDAILRAYRERKDINKALRDTSQAVGKLHCLCLILACFVSAAMCGILTFFLGLTFIFGENAKQFFQSIIFLFAMHPYDVGDRVYIDALQYIVTKVGLLGTEFRCGHHNARRSERQVDVIEFQLGYDTCKEKLVELKESINRYIDLEESREFSSNPLLAVKAIEDCNQLKLFLSLEHKSNWQNNTQRVIRKTRFLVALRDICLRLGLSYSLPVQKVIHLGAPR